jgi:hypothetical protein
MNLLKGASKQAPAVFTAMAIASATLLRADDTAGNTNRPEQIRLNSHGTNSPQRVYEIPSLAPLANRYINPEGRMFDTQIGEIFKDPPEAIEVKIKAVSAPGFLGLDYMVNARTDTGWWYQFGLGYETNFYVVALAFNQNGIPQCLPYHFPFDCKENDSIDLKMEITNNFVKFSIEDLDRRAQYTGITAHGTERGNSMYMQLMGHRFVGDLTKSAAGESPTGIFTEIQSTNVINKVPVQHYDLIRPTNMAQVEFFMTEANIVKQSYTMEKGWAVFHTETGWIDATPPTNLVYETGMQENSVKWMSAYRFKTGTFDR